MDLKFIKNIQFSKLIKVNGRLREFNFRKSNSSQEGFFTVDVIDERGGRIYFNMEKTEGAWKVTGSKIPDWVISNEPVYNEIIEEEFKSTN